jgi:uncharacterized protein DUF4129
MSRRRLVIVVFAIVALLAVVAVVAGGRPLGSTGGRGSGLPRAFWDYAFTSFLIIEALLAIIAFVGLYVFRRERVEVANYNRRTARALAVLLGIAFLVVFVGRHVNIEHLLHPNAPTATTAKGVTQTTGKNAKPTGTNQPEHVHFRWDELAVVLLALIVVAVAVSATNKRLAPGTRRRAPEVLAAALEESIDDLRADPDLRRAIIAAYARMEGALGAAGIPRHPAEAPLEYVERALLGLDTSADAVRRLTDLFLWARFSQHEPEPSMRDEAVDALVAVRDELRASELVPA